MGNISKMYERFGYGNGLCKDCKYYISGRYHDRSYRKCKVYGETRSAATDWKASAHACGLIDGEYSGDRAIVDVERGRRGNLDNYTVDGQISLF